MAVVALRQLNLSDGSTVDVGDTVPGADAWPNVGVWVKAGHVAHVGDGDEAAFKRALQGDGSPAAYAPMVPPMHLATAQHRAMDIHGRLHPKAPAPAVKVKSEPAVIPDALPQPVVPAGAPESAAAPDSPPDALDAPDAGAAAQGEQTGSRVTVRRAVGRPPRR